MKTQLEPRASLFPENFESLNSMIVLMETENAYLMQVDLPSIPVAVGEIIAKKNGLTVTTGKESHDGQSASLLNNQFLPSNLLSLRTIGGKIKSFYQGGALYVLLPKMAAPALKTPAMG